MRERYRMRVSSMFMELRLMKSVVGRLLWGVVERNGFVIKIIEYIYKMLTEIEELYNFIYPLAVEAGEILLEGYERTEKNVDIKGAFYDVVTDYDNKIEEFLMGKILATYPQHKFIGEEETAKNNNMSKELTDAPTWIIDPIDGTSNFIKQIPHVSVSIGLSINKQIVLGIVNNPAQKKLYTAKLGQGAFCNDDRIHVSDCEHLNAANVAYEVCLLHAPKIRNKHIKRIYYIGSQARR